jgi:Asp-tRNA(Asn)/Glu-tRNA(Gln) amidotransferase A subunit family amidase
MKNYTLIQPAFSSNYAQIGHTMKSFSFRIINLILIPLVITSCTKESEPIDPLELTISQIHKAYEKGNLTAEKLTSIYIERIHAYDQSTQLNSIVLINPKAMDIARQLDEEFQSTGIQRPLHGIPIIVKDNYNTIGLQTAGGSIALKGFEPLTNAYQVQKLIEAGAIVLAKSNMAEWAFSPRHTVSSLVGETLNPYNLAHVPAGSSGGTAAAVASNLGAAGLGTDTGNSIRGPSSHNSLVGFRSTLGLTSREGIIPLYLRNDVGGPMCRTVEDATRILEVIAGYDPKDPITRYSEGKVPENYQQFLDKNGLKGARIGVFRQLTEDMHPEIETLFERAIKDLDSLGAVIINPFDVPGFDSLRSNQWCSEFKKDVENYLATYVKWDSLKSIEDIISVGGYDEDVANRLKYLAETAGRRVNPEIPCLDPYTDERRIAFREAIENEMDRLQLDALIYPSWNYPPARIEKFDVEYQGDNSQVIAPHTGQPAFTIPMGFTPGNLPAGLQFLGRMFDESTLIRVTYAYEQGTLHRKPPQGFNILKE